MHFGLTLVCFLLAMDAVALVGAYSPWRPFTLLRLANDDNQFGRTQGKRSVRSFDGYEKRMPAGGGYGWDQCEFSPLSCLLRRRRSSPSSQAVDYQPVTNEEQMRTLMLMQLVRG